MGNSFSPLGRERFANPALQSRDYVNINLFEDGKGATARTSEHRASEGKRTAKSASPKGRIASERATSASAAEAEGPLRSSRECGELSEEPGTNPRSLHLTLACCSLLLKGREQTHRRLMSGTFCMLWVPLCPRAGNETAAPQGRTLPS